MTAVHPAASLSAADGISDANAEGTDPDSAPPEPQERRGCFALSVAVALAVGLSGCGTAPVPPPSLTAESGAARFEARSLSDPGLRQFLRENLGHEPATWDFDALCWTGFYYQPSLELARAQWATARAAERTAAQKPNPTLSLTPGYDFTHQAGVSPWMPSVGLDLLLPASDKRQRQRDVASADAEAARLGLANAAWQLRGDLRKALLDAASAARREQVLAAQATAQRHVVRLLEQRLAAGAIAASEVTIARTALLRAETAVADTRVQAAVARAHVAATLGIPVAALEGVRLPLPPVPVALSPDALTLARGQALRSRADVLGALAKYRSAQAALELEAVRRRPDIHLGPGYQWDQGLNKWTLGISFELPVFNHNEGPIAEAVARRAEAAAQFNVVQGQAVAAIDAAEAALQGAAAQRERARQLQKEVVAQTAAVRQRQELGAADELELASAQLDEAVTQSALADAEAAVNAAAGQLEDALQIPFAHSAAVTNATRGIAQP